MAIKNTAYKEIEDIIEKNIEEINKIDFKGRRKYEKDFCDVTGFKEAERNEQNKFDCKYGGIQIELKKGNRWLNLVRYISEYDERHITLFIFLNDKKKFKAIHGYRTNDIIRKILKLTPEQNELIVKLNKAHNEKLNIQRPISMEELKSINSIFEIKME